MAFMKMVLLILVAAGTCVARDVKESKGKTFPPFTIFDDHHGQYVRVTGKSGRYNRSSKLTLKGNEIRRTKANWGWGQSAPRRPFVGNVALLSDIL